MPDSSVAVTEGSGKNIDTRTNAGGDHRQVVVMGDPSVVESVASVQASDPSSATEGLVVREPNTTAIVAGLDSVRVRNLIDGTISTVAAITNITNSIAVHVLSTGGTISVNSLATGTIAISAKDGTIGVYFPPGNSLLGTVNTVQRVQNVVDGTLTTVTGVDRVRNVVDGTLTTVSRVDRVINVVDGTLSTVTRVSNVVDGTLSTVGRVQNVVDGTLSNVYRVHNLVAGTVTVSGSNTTLAVFFDRGNPAVSVYGSDGTTQRNLQTNTGGAIKVFDIVTGTIAAVTSITNSVAVHILSTNGTMAVNVGTVAGTIYVGFSPAKPIVLADNQHTASIFTVSGSTSGVSVSGVTLVSPSANYSFKVFAIGLTTTAQAHLVAKFTNGAGTSPTEYWRYGLQAPSAGIAGANLAVPPPAYLFATGTSTTLSLVLDTASLVHYSVSYIKESA